MFKMDVIFLITTSEVKLGWDAKDYPHCSEVLLKESRLGQ